ncbi:hypothetical protein DYH09_01195 [bacterium CPR1]|nr:hypothetical protein [bacterium CPR1]
MVAELLTRGADPRARWRRPSVAERLDPGLQIEGVTPLHTCRHVEVARVLLRAGAEVAAATSSGRTPLHWLVQTGPVPMVKELLGSGAPVNAPDSRGNTPLHLTDLPSLLTLLENGADWGQANQAGQLPLSSGLRRWLPDQEKAACQRLRSALRSGLDCRRADADGTTLLHLAVARAKKGDLVALLLEAGADPRVRDAAGDSPLAHWAREGAGFQAGQSLLSVLTPVDVRASNHAGRTPLHLAVLAGQPRRHVEALLSAGADPKACDADGATPSELARGKALARLLRPG